MALVITIIVLLILAGVSISMLTGDNGILTQAQNAKIETIVAGVKEKLQLSKTEATMQKKDITPETLLAEGKVARTVQLGDKDKENYYMYYALKDGAYDEMQGLGKGNIASLRDVFLIDDDLNLKYIASNGKEYGDELKNKILNDETQIRFSSPAFSAYVSKISGASEEEMKFKWMKNQTSLTIDDPSIDSLADLVFFPNLKRLTIRQHNINSMNGIENCSKLETLDIDSTLNIDDYTAVSKLSNLTSFIRNNGNDFDNYIDVLKLCSNLKSLTLNGDKIQKIEGLESLTNLTTLSLYNNQIKTIEGLDNLTSLTTLSLSSNQIKTIEGLDNLTNLEILYLNNNQLTTTKGLENLTNLTSLSISGNQIKTIEGLDNLTNLTSLNLGTNQITTIEGMERLTKLTRLELQNNQISDITPLKANTALTYLDLRNNQIRDITPLKANTALTYLDLRNNPIDTDYTVDSSAALDKIGEILDRNGQILIDEDKLGLFKNYTTLDLSGKNLTTLDIVKDMTNLTSLNISNNQITLGDEESRNILKRLTNLKSLNISNNPLKDISAINSLKNLTSLSLRGVNNIKLAQIEDIISNVRLYVTTETFKTIVNCDSQKITKIDVYNAGITELPDLSGFNKLEHLEVGANGGVTNWNIISNITSLKELHIGNCDLHGKVPNLSRLVNLETLDLNTSSLWTEDLKNLGLSKNNSNLKSINLSSNVIIDATSLLDLNNSVKIGLQGNINLSQDSKDKLGKYFGSKVSFNW